MRKRLNIADFRASDGLNPVVMQKLNTNFWNILEGFEEPEIVMVSSVSRPEPHTDESLWYKLDTGTLYIWSDTGDGWDWVSATDVVINDPETVQFVTEIAMAAGGDKNYVWTQSQSAAVWTINHNLNKYPSIRVEDSAGNDVIGDYEYLDANTVVATFTGAFSGKAYLN